MKKLFTFFICIVLTVGLFSQDVLKSDTAFWKSTTVTISRKYYEAIELYQAHIIILHMAVCVCFGRMYLCYWRIWTAVTYIKKLNFYPIVKNN